MMRLAIYFGSTNIKITFDRKPKMNDYINLNGVKFSLNENLNNVFIKTCREREGAGYLKYTKVIHNINFNRLN